MKIIIANWKAHPDNLQEARDLYSAEVGSAALQDNVRTLICPPADFINDLAAIDRRYLGAQDLFGGITDVGVSHVLVGHSDRRYKIGESDEIINNKIKAALSSGIIPILLVGERERGDDRRLYIEQQMKSDLAGLNNEQISRVLFAYEPVWAISTNKDAVPDTPENTVEAVAVINKFLFDNYNIESVACLYGGSINEGNVADFLKHPEIIGAVIGAASLRKEEFANILKIASTL